MKPSIRNKLATLQRRSVELAELLSSPEIVKDQNQYRMLSKEYADLEPLLKVFAQYLAVEAAIVSATELLKDPDAEIRSCAQEEIQQAEVEKASLVEKINILLLPEDPNDSCNIFLEIRAGAGGNEAAIFAEDLLRMYCRYAEIKGWRTELISESFSEVGGYKEVIVRIIGKDVYAYLKFESGVHRVQRVPVTESQGRIHTSTCTVAVLPEVEEIESVEIDSKDLRIDTYRASGAGGQHVNRTDSAVRITHIPTGVVVECQEERSQHKNKAKALKLLTAKILAAERSKQIQQEAQTRRNLVGTGDRSERIRTYNYPQSRVTDHRINLTLYKLAEIMEGNLNCIVEPLIHEHQIDLLTHIAEER